MFKKGVVAASVDMPSARDMADDEAASLSVRLMCMVGASWCSWNATGDAAYDSDELAVSGLVARDEGEEKAE